MRERLLRLFFVIFGLSSVSWGGLALMAQLERRYVAQQQKLTQEEFTDLVAIAWTVPGPVAGNVAVLLGYRLCGAWGAALAGIAATLPFFLVMGVCAVLFQHYGLTNLPATALTQRFALVLAALIGVTFFRQAPRLLDSWDKRILCVGATLLLWVFHQPINFFAILAGSFAYGWFRTKPQASPPMAVRLSTFEKLTLPLLAGALATFVFLPQSTNDFVQGLRVAGAGLTLFGGGFSAIPVLKTLYFEGAHALSAPVLTLALTLTSLCPGPLLNIVPFFGFLQSGGPGGIAATLSIFVPTAVLAIIVLRQREALRQLPRFEAGLAYLRAATTAFLAETVLRLVSHTPFSLPNVLTALVAVVALWRFKTPVYWLYLAVGVSFLTFH